MRRVRLSAPILVALALSVAAGGPGCARGRGPGHAATRADSSFAAITFARGRTPTQLSLVGGKAVFDRYCVICHGETGGGDGFNAYNVKTAFGVSPTAFSDSAQMAAVRDTQALAAIRDGGAAAGKSPAMPAWGHTLTPREIADVWQYARTLATTAHDP